MSQRPADKKIDNYKIKYFNKEIIPEYNLWGISDELDKYYFRTALISELVELLRILKTDNIEASMLQYLDLLDISALFEKNEFDSGSADVRFKGTWTNVLCYFLEKESNAFFTSFIYTKQLQELIETNVILSNKSSYTIATFEYGDIFSCDLIDNPILESETHYAIHFRNDINVHLIPYFKEIGLDIFVKTLIDTIESIKNKLEMSVIKTRKVEDELFDFN